MTPARLRPRIVAGLMVAALAGPALAQDYPSRPVTIIVPLADRINYAKEKPAPLSSGPAGPGTPHHLYAEPLKSMTAIDMPRVPYGGSGPLVNDVGGGPLPLTFVDVPPAVGVIQTGKVRAIA